MSTNLAKSKTHARFGFIASGIRRLCTTARVVRLTGSLMPMELSIAFQQSDSQDAYCGGNQKGGLIRFNFDEETKLYRSPKFHHAVNMCVPVNIKFHVT